MSKEDSRVLATALMEQLRATLTEIIDDDHSRDMRINMAQFERVFCGVFVGVRKETIDELFKGFAGDERSVDCAEMLNDARLPKILLVLNDGTATTTAMMDSNRDALVNILRQKVRHAFGACMMMQSNTIDLPRFKQVFDSIFMSIDDDIYRQIFAAFDTTHSGEIDYTQLVAHEKLGTVLLLLHDHSIAKLRGLQSQQQKEHIHIADALQIARSVPIHIENDDRTGHDNQLKQENEALKRKLSAYEQERVRLQHKVQEWRQKYDDEVEQNKAFQAELEKDLEEEYRVKLSQLRMEYELKLMEQRTQCEQLLRLRHDKHRVVVADRRTMLIHNIFQKQQPHKSSISPLPFPSSSMPPASDFASAAASMPSAATQMGVITLRQLHMYDARNSQRRLICIYGVVFDVTHCGANLYYGVNGTRAAFIGHDVTLCVIFNQWDTKWLDVFRQLGYTQMERVKTFIKMYECEFKAVGKLKRYQEIQSNWPRVTAQELRELQTEQNLKFIM